MNTSEQQVLSEEELEQFKKELDKFIATCDKEKVECVRVTKLNMEEDVRNLTAVYEAIDRRDIYPDELVMLLHNIISIVPEEQYRFLENITQLLLELPEGVRSKEDVNYVVNSILKFKTSDLDTKLQVADLSRYWASYRSFVYKYGCYDNHRQKAIQKRMHEKMIRICNRVIAKRTRGIKSAEVLLRNFTK